MILIIPCSVRRVQGMQNPLRGMKISPSPDIAKHFRELQQSGRRDGAGRAVSHDAALGLHGFRTKIPVGDGILGQMRDKKFATRWAAAR